MKSIFLKSFFFFSGTVLLLLSNSCGNDAEKKAKAEADSARIQAIRKATPNKDQFKEEIRKAEEKMKASKTLDPVVANQMIKAYLDYANIFVNDSCSADYLFRSADIATGIGNYDQAIVLYNKIQDVYPTYKYVVESLYLEAMIYDSKLPGQEPKAKELYERLIKNYPKNKLAEDAKVAIQHLGKTDEELIQEFEKKNATSAKK